MLKKLDRLKVFVLSVLIWHPLPFLLSIIKVKHGCHRIDAQSVHMIVLHPEQRAPDQKILDLIFAVIKYLRSPIGMLPLPRICILIQTGAVKLRQPMGVARKMSGVP